MIYIDCGYYVGAAKELNCVQNDWTLYGFEAHPGLEVPKWVKRKAVWINDDKVKFNIGGRDDAASIDGTSGHTEGTPQIEVQAFDFSKFVGDLPNDMIICSMDIEGAEFPVLEKMLDDGTMDKITFLDVEFHHRIMGEAKGPEDAKYLIKRIQDLGVIIHLKVPVE
jgi:FkbM family methyltransferase